MARDRIRKHRRRIKDAVDNYIAGNPNATAEEIEEGVKAELKKEYKSSFLLLLMPLILEVIKAWLRKRES